VQDHGELAGECDLGLLHASASCQTHGPALERARFYRLGQDDVRDPIRRQVQDRSVTMFNPWPTHEISDSPHFGRIVLDRDALRDDQWARILPLIPEVVGFVWTGF
jgi:hypothetical protein